MRILVFQTAYLGDVVLTLPLLDTIRKNIPDARITCVVQPKWQPILENSGSVNDVISFDKRGNDKGIWGTFSFIKRLRKERFDVALCPHPSFRSAMILKLARIPKRIGFDSSSGNMFFTKKIHREESVHEAVRILSLASAIGIGRSNWVKKPVLNPPADVNISEVLSRHGIGDGLAGILGVHPGSVWATKRWLPQRFGKVCKIAADQGFPVFVFGTENERPLVEQVVNRAGHENVKPIIGLSLKELVAVYSKLSAYLTNDSGPMHIAAALGVPVVSIFGSTVPAQGYSPLSDIHAIIETDRLACRPCGPHGHQKCPLEHFDCMNKIRTNSVMLALRVMMGGFDGTGFLKAVLSQQGRLGV